jgi:hypothetical protein
VGRGVVSAHAHVVAVMEVAHRGVVHLGDVSQHSRYKQASTEARIKQTSRLAGRQAGQRYARQQPRESLTHTRAHTSVAAPKKAGK